MSLKIQGLELADFRSYSSFTLEGIDDLTIFYGPNAAGKTNIIEAIQLMTALTSFRRAKTEELIKQGLPRGRVRANVTDGNRQLELELRLEAPAREYWLNGKRRPINTLKGLIPSIIFSPEDLSLVKGSDSYRHREVDLIGSQVNANYYQLMRDFEKLLRHRNKLLKDEASDALLDSMTDVFVKVAMQLTNYRRALLERMAPHISAAYEDISNGEPLSVSYMTSWEDANSLEEKLQETRELERVRHLTLAGPNRDRIAFEVSGLDAGTFASQGQQRSVVLAVKMAEVQLIDEMLDQKPVLLLDDVMSELDAARRQAMVERLLPDTQTFITTANIEYFDQEMLERARVVDIG